jgi:hypothetical protein
MRRLQASSFNRAGGRSTAWLLIFLLFQIGCQLALLSQYVGPFRVILRTGAFGASILLLLFVPGRGKRHPAANVALVILGIVAIAFFHPLTNNAIAGFAQFLMYAAILGPLFWVPATGVDLATFKRALFVLWTFHALSSGCGILQIKYPGHFQPTLSTAVSRFGAAYLDGLKIRTASGEVTFRPMGLTDSPGGAATSGFYAVLLGMGFFVAEHSAIRKMLFVSGIFAGTMCLYLSQVRMYMVMTAVCIAVFYCCLVLRREKSKVFAMSMLIPLVVTLALGGAVAIGGVSVIERLRTFSQDRPTDVYYHSRGFLLDYTMREIAPQHPFGLGLGRWGMIYSYFGSDRDPRKSMMWAEIQWTGWLFDGGIPLIFAYVLAIGVAFTTSFKIAISNKNDELWMWAALVLAYSLGAFAGTFTSPFFISQGGMEFWLLNAALFAVVQSQALTPRVDRLRSRIHALRSARSTA